MGEPVCIIPKSAFDRLERLAYRQQLALADQSGDAAFIEREIRKNQLSESELKTLSLQHTPIESWPDLGEDAIADIPAEEEVKG